MNLKKTAKSAGLFALSGIAGFSSCKHIDSSALKDQPNIVIIMADDMGYSDLGCFGSEIHTPNIDALARQGVVMTNFYNTGRCCPSRAALLTGLYPHQTGIGDMTGNDGHPSYQGYLNKQCVTIAELLRETGYSTLISGKWHVGSDPKYWPLERGFDRFFGFPRGGGVYFYPFRKGRAAVLDNKEIKVDSASFYSTDAITDHAIQFVKEQAPFDRPFFLYMAHIAPHFPLQAWPEDIKKYRGKYMKGFHKIRNERFEHMKESGIIGKDYTLPVDSLRVLEWDLLSPTRKDSFDLRMAIYAAQIDRMDQGIGRFINTLKELGQYENTIIIFLSDNGGSHEDCSRWLSGTGHMGGPDSQYSYLVSWANVSNTPFRMYKHWVHEGGISTPLIISYPAVIKEHRIDRRIGHIVDLMPTCLELAGANYPEAFQNIPLTPLAGKSLLPVILNKPGELHEALFWEHEGNEALRKNNWKIVREFGEEKWHLYNMNHDRAELIDLSADYPELLTELIDLYFIRAKEYGVLPRSELLELRNGR